MTKAEQEAFEAYPCAPSEFNTFEHQTIAIDSNSRDRGIYLRGYEQAKKDMFQAILVVLEKNYGFDTLDRVEFVMKYERMTEESIPDDWLEKGVMKTVKLQSLEQKEER